MQNGCETNGIGGVSRLCVFHTPSLPLSRFQRFLRLTVPPLSLAGTMIFLYYLIDQLNPTSKEKKAARKKVSQYFLFALLKSPFH